MSMTCILHSSDPNQHEKKVNITELPIGSLCHEKLRLKRPQFKMWSAALLFGHFHLLLALGNVVQCAHKHPVFSLYAQCSSLQRQHTSHHSSLGGCSVWSCLFKQQLIINFLGTQPSKRDRQSPCIQMDFFILLLLYILGTGRQAASNVCLAHLHSPKMWPPEYTGKNLNLFLGEHVKKEAL